MSQPGGAQVSTPALQLPLNSRVGERTMPAAPRLPLTLQVCVQLLARLPRRLLPLLQRQDGQRTLRADLEVLRDALRAPAAGREEIATAAASARCPGSARAGKPAQQAPQQAAQSLVLTTPRPCPPSARREPARVLMTLPSAPHKRNPCMPPCCSFNTPPARATLLRPHPCLLCSSHIWSLAALLSCAFFHGSAALPSVRSTPQLT